MITIRITVFFYFLFFEMQLSIVAFTTRFYTVVARESPVPGKHCRAYVCTYNYFLFRCNENDYGLVTIVIILLCQKSYRETRYFYVRVRRWRTVLYPVSVDENDFVRTQREKIKKEKETDAESRFHTEPFHRVTLYYVGV